MVDVFFISYSQDTPSRGYWDMQVLEDIFDNTFSPLSSPYKFNIQEGSYIPERDFAVIVLPARAQIKYLEKFNQELNNVKAVVIFVVGDEEGLFPVDKVAHPNSVIYVMSAIEKHKGPYKPLINGYPPQLKKYKPEIIRKTTNFFFSGQITHERREAFYSQLLKRNDGVLVKTDGFTLGLPHDKYYSEMARARVAPCPSGPETPDTFRLYEALELECVPLVDHRTPSGKSSPDYWTHLFGEKPPFPIVTDDERINDCIDEVLENFPTISNKVSNWWTSYKQKLVNNIYNDIQEMSIKAKQ